MKGILLPLVSRQTQNRINSYKKRNISNIFLLGNINWTECLGLGEDRTLHDADKSGMTPLLYFSQLGNKSLVDILISQGVDVNLQRKWDGVSSLWLAASHNHCGVIRSLINAHANIDIRAKDGTTALYIASESGHLESVQILLHNQASVDIPHIDGTTPLWRSCYRGYIDIVKCLEACDANLNIISSFGSALCIAAQKGRIDVVQYLISKNVDVNLQAETGENALSLACQNKHCYIVKLLLDVHTDIQPAALISACSKGYWKIGKLLLHCNADIHGIVNGTTALHAAAANDKSKTIDMLLKWNPRIVKDSDGLYPSEVAHNNGYTALASKLKNYEITITNKKRTSSFTDYSSTVIKHQYEDERNGFSGIKSLKPNLKTEGVNDHSYFKQTDKHLGRGNITSDDANLDSIIAAREENSDNSDIDNWTFIQSTDVNNCMENEVCVYQRHLPSEVITCPIHQDVKKDDTIKEVDLDTTPTFFKDGQKDQLSTQDKDELEKDYTAFRTAVESSEDLIKMKVFIHAYKGKSEKKIFVAVQNGMEGEAIEYLNTKCPELLTRNIIDVQEEKKSIKKFLVETEDNEYIFPGKIATLLSQNVPDTDIIGIGSIACLAQGQFGKVYLVTAKHVIEKQRGSSDLEAIENQSYESIDNLYKMTYIGPSYFGIHKEICFRGKSTIVDIALIPLPIKISHQSQEFQHHKIPISKGEDCCQLHQIVEKRGAKTGLTKGVIIETDIFDHNRSSGFIVKAVKELEIDRALVYDYDEDGMFADTGDSGAMVKVVNGNKEAVGLVYMLFDSFTDHETKIIHKNVTYCVKLEACLKAMQDKWGFKLSLFDYLCKPMLYLDKKIDKRTHKRNCSYP